NVVSTNGASTDTVDTSSKVKTLFSYPIFIEDRIMRVRSGETNQDYISFKIFWDEGRENNIKVIFLSGTLSCA
ncbi:MAG: hypothetical protein AAFN93_29920, partial [Bacteroidota bacterium]